MFRSGVGDAASDCLSHSANRYRPVAHARPCAQRALVLVLQTMHWPLVKTPTPLIERLVALASFVAYDGHLEAPCKRPRGIGLTGDKRCTFSTVIYVVFLRTIRSTIVASVPKRVLSRRPNRLAQDSPIGRRASKVRLRVVLAAGCGRKAGRDENADSRERSRSASSMAPAHSPLDVCSSGLAGST